MVEIHPSNNERFLIVSTGRCGSSLLSAILAHAGADFDLPDLDSWSRSSGAYEHPKLEKAYAWFRLMQALPTWPAPSRYLRQLTMKKMDRLLLDAMSKAKYAKTTNLVYLVQPISKLGYRPKIIISYRQFQGYATSRYRRTNLSFSDLTEKYIDTYGTALLQLSIWGGCLVSYEEMINSGCSEWIDVVCKLTNLEKELVAKCRNDVIKPRSNIKASLSNISKIDNRIIELMKELSKYKGQAV